MTAHIGLFFPYFHFPNDEWVKLSALYWDKLYRIVPYGYETQRDSDLVKALANDGMTQTSFISSLHPEDFYPEMEAIKWAFIKLIENHTAELGHHYGVDRRHEWRDDPYTTRFAPQGNPKLAYIYNEKIEHELREVLLMRGLGTTRSDTGPDYHWIGMHPRLANVYMAALAETLAEKTQCHPITHEPKNYFAVSGFTFERLAQVLLEEADFVPNTMTQEENEAALAVIAFRAVMPRQIQEVPLDKMMALREKYGGEFGKFQEFVHRIVGELPQLTQIEGKAFVHDHLEAEFIKTVQPKLDELEETMNSLGLETLQTFFNLEVKVPSLFLGAGLVTGTTLVNPILGATAAVALGLLKIFGDKRKQVKEAIQKSDVSYLQRIQDDLTPKGSLDWLEVQARKTIFGL